MLALTTIFLLLIRNTELYKQYVCGNLIPTVMLIDFSFETYVQPRY